MPPRRRQHLPASSHLRQRHHNGPVRQTRSLTDTRVATRAAQMPICIECRHPVNTLWTQYSGAGDKSTGHNIRLTVCRKCGRFCDKYVEHDFVVLFIDLVLIKPQVRLQLRLRRPTVASSSPQGIYG